jgi:hypothetical protein
VFEALADADHRESVRGPHYTDVLKELHDAWKPRNYFEIGSFEGATLELASCLTVAVDPRFRLRRNVVGEKPACLLFQETSDNFFDRRDLSVLLGGPLGLAFLDGMHHAEVLLRDFMNTERYCDPASIIVLHDCLPPGYHMTSRDQTEPRIGSIFPPDWWTGDVWQLIPVLRQFRPDLSIALLDSHPTGLAVITNLDPASDVLTNAYDKIEAKRLPRLSNRRAYDAYWKSAQIQSSSEYLTRMSRRTI